VDLTQRVSIGHGERELPLTRAGFGCAPIGNFSEAVTDEAARAALEAAWDAGIRWFDTAPWYGIGLSERRLGAFLRNRPREDYVLSTKVGRVLRPWANRHFARRHRGPWVDPPDFEVVFDYSYDGVIRSFEDSLQRLGLARVDVLLIHDLDRGHFALGADYDAYLAQLVTGGHQALRDLRADGTIGAIGCGVNLAGQIPQFLDLFDIDVFLVAGPYTLLDQSSLEELERCRREGVSVVIGSAFRAGILATGTAAYTGTGPMIFSEEELERVRRMEAVCDELGVRLPAAAIQFPHGHPAVRSVLFGALDGDQVRETVGFVQRPLPAELWQRLRDEGVIVPGAPFPAGG
jgi:D-threo-aldose 1-dehydrogenase